MPKINKNFPLVLVLGLAFALTACQAAPVTDEEQLSGESTSVTSESTTAAPPSEQTSGQETIGDKMNKEQIPAPSGYERSEEYTDTVNIHMDNGDDIVIELYPEIAPITVANFQKLVDQGFYDGLIFHRVIPGFMIQGGDPEGTGMGGSDEQIKGEFSENGVDNDLLHTRGVISMARAMDMDSASSQFFLMHADAPHLDGAYAAFGKIIYGIEAVDRVAELETDANDRPLEPPVMTQVFFVKEAAGE